MKNIGCIGLFGTCGTSTWRADFIRQYSKLGINYFNPQVENWSPELADIEAQHLKRDEIILFPVTSETYGTGSLAETGFSILQAVQSNSTRFVIVMIVPDLDEALKADQTAYKESLRARTLVSAHLAANPMPNVFVVSDFHQMLNLSVQLYQIVNHLNDLIEETKMIA
jgi:hypothetical protein